MKTIVLVIASLLAVTACTKGKQRARPAVEVVVDTNADTPAEVPPEVDSETIKFQDAELSPIYGPFVVYNSEGTEEGYRQMLRMRLNIVNVETLRTQNAKEVEKRGIDTCGIEIGADVHDGDVLRHLEQTSQDFPKWEPERHIDFTYTKQDVQVSREIWEYDKNQQIKIHCWSSPGKKVTARFITEYFNSALNYSLAKK